MSSKTLYVVVLNYNNFSDTIECVKSFEKLNNPNYKLIVVDNSSDLDCINKIRCFLSEKKYATYIVTGKNMGYAAGNNVGIKYAVEHGADYIAIVNNDVILNQTSFDSCIKILDEDETVAFAGPAILEYDSNKIQYTGGKINYFKITSPHTNVHKDFILEDKRINCDYVGGACMIFKPNIIKKIGYIPEVYFLYWEETEWCSLAKKIGMKCICSLGGFVNHKGSATIKKEPGIESYYLERNRIIFSLRNNKSILKKIFSIGYVFCYSFIRGILLDKNYLNYLPYYIDGLLGKDKFKKI